jgi:hypothetical protein
LCLLKYETRKRWERMVIASHLGLKEDRNPYDAAQETQPELARIGSPCSSIRILFPLSPFPVPFLRTEVGQSRGKARKRVGKTTAIKKHKRAQMERHARLNRSISWPTGETPRTGQGGLQPSSLRPRYRKRSVGRRRCSADFLAAQPVAI